MKAATKMSTRTVDNPKVVSREEWLVARKKLLAREKQLTRERDAVAAERRQLPWVKVEKNYVFDSPSGKKTLADLFNGKSQLIVYHLMFGPEWQEACPSCSFNMDHSDPALVHLAQRDVSFAAVSRAPISKSAWVGSSIGFPLSEVISTTTITSPSLQGIWPKAKSTTTLLSSNSQARKLLESAFSTRTTTGTSSTPIPPMLAVPKPR